MQKKFLVGLTATATAASMLIAPAITVFAVDNPIEYTDGAEHTENGDIVRTDGGTAVIVRGDNTTVHIDGNVDASGVVTRTDSSGNTQYSGATGISIGNYSDSSGRHDYSGISVDVTGNVTGGSTGIGIRGNNTVSVDKDVKVTGTDNTVRMWYSNGQSELVNTTSGDAISTDDDANITIKGNVSGVNNGFLINPNNNNSKGSIVVEGVISASSGRGISIYTPNSTYPGGLNYANVDDALNDLPDLTIYKIQSSGSPIHVGMTTDDDSTSETIGKELLKAINYIVKQNSESVSQYGMTVTGTTHNNSTGLDTVHIGEAFTVAANLPDGYSISGGENVSVTKNENGTFTLKLTNEKGGIFVTAYLIPVNNDDGSTSYVVATDNSDALSDPSKAPAGAIVVSTASAGTAAAATDPISPAKPALTATYNLGKVTPMQYKNSIINNVEAAPKNGAFNIVTDRVACFDSKMIDAMAARSDIDINVVFNYGGRLVKVVIPAGYDIRTLLDGNGYCGFLRLLSILGESKV